MNAWQGRMAIGQIELAVAALSLGLQSRLEGRATEANSLCNLAAALLLQSAEAGSEGARNTLHRLAQVAQGPNLTPGLALSMLTRICDFSRRAGVA